MTAVAVWSAAKQSAAANYYGATDVAEAAFRTAIDAATADFVGSRETDGDSGGSNAADEVPAATPTALVEGPENKGAAGGGSPSGTSAATNAFLTTLQNAALNDSGLSEPDDDGDPINGGFYIPDDAPNGVGGFDCEDYYGVMNDDLGGRFPDCSTQHGVSMYFNPNGAAGARGVRHEEGREVLRGGRAVRDDERSLR